MQPLLFFDFARTNFFENFFPRQISDLPSRGRHGFSSSVTSAVEMRFFFFFVFAIISAAKPHSSRIVWMCLDRCNDSMEEGLKEISSHSSVLTGVSYEAFDLGLGGTLIDNHFSDPTKALQDLGLETYPMITTASNALLLDLFFLVPKPAPIISQAGAHTLFFFLFFFPLLTVSFSSLSRGPAKLQRLQH